VVRDRVYGAGVIDSELSVVVSMTDPYTVENVISCEQFVIISQVPRPPRVVEQTGVTVGLYVGKHSPLPVGVDIEYVVNVVEGSMTVVLMKASGGKRQYSFWRTYEVIVSP
jgi:hypothetical protein